MTPSEWTLLAIASGYPSALQPVELQKSLFLLGQRLPKKLLGARFYSFQPYDYGPFSAQVYLDAESLEDDGLVEIARPPQARYRQYRATEKGLANAGALGAGLPKPVAEFVRDVVTFTQSLSFNDLVSAIYRAYPDMRVNSVFQGQ